MIIAGVDEAGYGPLLGPLIVSGVALAVPDELADRPLWEPLSASVCRSPGRRDHRLAIADSKKLYKGLGRDRMMLLEKAALVMLATTRRRPDSLRSLLGLISPQAHIELDRHPWYESFDVTLPVTLSPDGVSMTANAVCKDMAVAGMALAAVYSEIVPEAQFNHLVARTRNKATVLMGCSLRIALKVMERFKDQRLRLIMDRHGGREHYTDALMTFFEGAGVRIIEETDLRSAYILDVAGRQVQIEFATKGDRDHLPVALASIFSKYQRELLMMAVNQYFGSRVEGLAPTAGYYTDALRFLSDIESAVIAGKIDRNLLVRSR